jgi:eukaryotic-like serine/threonine-protein kinase
VSGVKSLDPPAGEGAPGPESVGRYMIFDEIGVGGMASVHLGMLTGAVGFRRIVALKQLHTRFINDPDFVAQFINEARLASRIHHANVVQTLDVVWTGTQLILVLEYVDGDTLNRVLRTAVERSSLIPIDVACSIVVGLLQGLHAAHEVKDEEGVPLDIVHRDVSPQNILIARDGVARVLDFGVAKALAQSPNTQSGLLKGKFGYMAPEQILRGHVDRRTDVFAAGVVLWETLLCRRLFQATKNVEQALSRVVAAEIPAPSTYRPEISPALDAIVLRAVDRDPERRFQSAEELAIALENCVTVARPHVVKTWFEPLASPELVQRAELIRKINRRYGPPGRSTPHPNELAEEARAALAAAHDERQRRAGVHSPSSPPSRSGKFAIGALLRRSDSGVRERRSSNYGLHDDLGVHTRRSRLVPEGSDLDTLGTPLSRRALPRISVRLVSGAVLALVMVVSTWVTATGQTKLESLGSKGTGELDDAAGRSGVHGVGGRQNASDAERLGSAASAPRDVRVRSEALRPAPADGKSGAGRPKGAERPEPTHDMGLRPTR